MYTAVNNTYKDSKSLVLNKEFLIYLSVRCQKFAKAVDGVEKKSGNSLGEGCLPKTLWNGNSKGVGGG